MRARLPFRLDPVIAAALVLGIVLVGNAYLIMLGKVQLPVVTAVMNSVTTFMKRDDGPATRAILPSVDRTFIPPTTD